MTVGGDKGYDSRAFVKTMRELGVAPHVAQNTTSRSSAIDGRTTRHAGYAISQVIRKTVEHAGWDGKSRRPLRASVRSSRPERVARGAAGACRLDR